MFEDNLKKLEEMAKVIRSEETTLDECIKAYEEGIKAYDECKKILEETKGKIEVYHGQNV
ncbi:MAG: exodeoxyribonuclease VII small subunit [Firmicutes bacterium]|nr:exodeoxyribonuclease VII small subunit [Bacillota bacterium]